MKHIPKILAYACIILAWAELAQSKEWRGIVPLHSTRADVERLLGPPISPGGFEYDLKDEYIVILYTDSQCNVPPETVVTITVAPKGEQRLTKAGFDLSNFKVIQHKESHTPEAIYYVNNEEGISLESREGLDIVLAVTYGLTAKQEKEFQCSKQPEHKMSAQPNKKP